jgi:hypothetical protein
LRKLSRHASIGADVYGPPAARPEFARPIMVIVPAVVVGGSLVLWRRRRAGGRVSDPLVTAPSTD